MTNAELDQEPKIAETLFANTNDFLKLVSAQIVFKVLNDSLNRLENEENEKTNKKSNNNISLVKLEPNESYVTMRKHLNLKRWHCISRPQYKYSCGISSLVSCWNYLYSTLGYGKLKPLSQEQALNILGFEAPFDDIRFGPFTGNKTLMKWFNTLNAHFKVNGRASFFYKPVEPNRTIGMTSRLAVDRLKNLLKSKNHAFIYHCYNHYCCPMGFELEPQNRETIYSSSSSSKNDDEFIEWLLIAETSRKYPTFHSIKWDDIDRDLSTRSPDFINIRKLDKGVQTRASKPTTSSTTETTAETSNNTETTEDKPPRVRKDGRNLHCFIMFQSFDDEQLLDLDAGSISVEDVDLKSPDNIIEDLNNLDDSDSE